MWPTIEFLAYEKVDLFESVENSYSKHAVVVVVFKLHPGEIYNVEVEDWLSLNTDGEHLKDKEIVAEVNQNGSIANEDHVRKNIKKNYFTNWIHKNLS